VAPKIRLDLGGVTRIRDNACLITRQKRVWFSNASRIRGCMVLEKGRDSVVGIATRYELDGPGIESRWGRGFPHTSRPVLGPSQHGTQWVTGVFRE